MLPHWCGAAYDRGLLEPCSRLAPLTVYWIVVVHVLCAGLQPVDFAAPRRFASTTVLSNSLHNKTIVTGPGRLVAVVWVAYGMFMVRLLTDSQGVHATQVTDFTGSQPAIWALELDHNCCTAFISSKPKLCSVFSSAITVLHFDNHLSSGRVDSQ